MGKRFTDLRIDVMSVSSREHEHELLRGCVIDALIPASKDITLESLLNDVQATDSVSQKLGASTASCLALTLQRRPVARRLFL